MGKATVAGGARAKEPVGSILASTLAVGSSVYLNENGSPVEYLVVNQGIPSNSSLYDASCDGTWLLRKDIYTTRACGGTNSYKSSAIHSYLNDTFFALFDSDIQSVIKQVKIPYMDGTGSSGAIATGSNGLPVHVFLLGGAEVGFTPKSSIYLPSDGNCLSYFNGASDSTRIAYLKNGTATSWWLRTPRTTGATDLWLVNASGINKYGNVENSNGTRPALIVPFNAVFDKDTLVLKGVA